ncbi:lipopolysaccharide biosynthesis protein RfbH, partial [uncultured Fusobacterium sp.]|uniref:lipopolysaccharide biosynthesis protein RfbH n=1 Tax=uncultured Fusobacterium sp. TaxID=159267 RepID=UPI0027DC9332
KVKEYHNIKFGDKKEFIEGETYINYGGRFFDEQEMMNLVDSSLDFWLTSGPWVKKFETKMAEYFDIKNCSLTNSGSSANLLAFMALTAQELGDRRIKRGDEVITVSAGFPTTVTPIIQYGAVPVFIDVTVPAYNIDVNMLEEALSEKTKAVMIAHTLGNPFNLQGVKDFCKKHNLWLVEDNCDALGSEYYIDGKWKKTGTIGDIGTSSFYPPHHMTMGEGGAVYTDNPLLHKLIKSFRDWGRDCWCESGVDDTCHMRFTKQYGELPLGYDHKYVYSHFGYNLKVTDMQAAIGVAQLDKLPHIVEARRRNWNRLYEGLKDIQDKIILPEPEKNSKPSWFGFLISVKEGTGKLRVELAKHLEANKIQTRNLFAGNLLKHPAFDEMRKTGEGFRVIGDLKNTDFIMNNTLWVGVYPGMTDEMLDFMIKKIKEYILG